ncbi:MAG: Cupin 2 conserved barrel domain protein [Frankiales bacterium]|nr:Cupin 2 conserved barrel domain protein [Frankiales bacterium]
MTVTLVRVTPGATQLELPCRRPDPARHRGRRPGGGARDGSVPRLRGGDTVVCPPGEEHRHGAAAETSTSHIAVLESLPGGQDPTAWLEPVPDKDHRKANARWPHSTADGIPISEAGRGPSALAVVALPGPCGAEGRRRPAPCPPGRMPWCVRWCPESVQRL